jgi:hypothetical protein
MIQRGSDTSFTNLWSLLLYIQSLLHYIENAQENKKNTILSYNIAENVFSCLLYMIGHEIKIDYCQFLPDTRRVHQIRNLRFYCCV